MTAMGNWFKRRLTQANITVTLHSRSEFTGTPTLTVSGTGGTLTAGTYYYLVTPLVSSVEKPVANIPGKAVTSGSTSKVTVTWSEITDATYKVYRSTDPSFPTPSLIASVAAGTVTLEDTNLSAAAGSPPESSGNPYVYFTDSTIYALPQRPQTSALETQQGIFIVESRLFLVAADTSVNHLDELTYDLVRYRIMTPPQKYPVLGSHVDVLGERMYSA